MYTIIISEIYVGQELIEISIGLELTEICVGLAFKENVLDWS